jgi:hypothetical protein
MKYFDPTDPVHVAAVNPAIWQSLPEVAAGERDDVIESTLKFHRYLGCTCEIPPVTLTVEVVGAEWATTAVHVDHADSCALYRRTRTAQN